MSLKILAPKEADQKKRDQEDFRVQKAVRLNDLISEEERRFNNQKAQNKQELEKLARQFIQHSEEMGRRKSALESEVRELEAKREKALEPVEPILTQAQAKLDEALKVVEVINLRSDEVINRARELSVKEATLASRQDELTEWGKTLTEDQKQANETRKDIETRLKELALAEEEDAERKAEFQKAFDNGMATIQLSKTEVDTQKRMNDEQAAENRAERVRLTDLQHTLERGFQELKQKQGNA